jgi:hypothetical protein
MELKIRFRHRRGRPREAYGDYIEWDEWQVVAGRTVVARFDLEEQAQEYVAEQRAAA